MARTDEEKKKIATEVLEKAGNLNITNGKKKAVIEYAEKSNSYSNDATLIQRRQELVVKE